VWVWRKKIAVADKIKNPGLSDHGKKRQRGLVHPSTLFRFLFGAILYLFILEFVIGRSIYPEDFTVLAGAFSGP